MNPKKARGTGVCPNLERGRRVPTPDDWHPTYPDGTVRGRVIDTMSDDSLRICFWGADDFGMELDIPPDEWDKETSRKWSRWLDGLGLVTKKMLFDMGFKRA